MNSLSNRLAACFNESGLSLRELEKQTGIPKSSLQRYMNGSIKNISNGRLIVLADALNKPLSYFLGVSDEHLSEENDVLFELSLRENFLDNPNNLIFLDDEEGPDLGKISLDIRRVFVDDFGIACSIGYAEKLAELLTKAIQTGDFLKFLEQYVDASPQMRAAALAVLGTAKQGNTDEVVLQEQLQKLKAQAREKGLLLIKSTRKDDPPTYHLMKKDEKRIVRGGDYLTLDQVKKFLLDYSDKE